MKILFLGYEEYLAAILKELTKTDFFTKNEVDVILAKPNSKNFRKKLIKLLKNKEFDKLIEALLIKYNKLLYKDKLKTAYQQLFLKEDTASLIKEEKVRFVEFDGLENINGLDDYDYMIVASFGTKIPADIFQKPKGKTLNIHPSFLPKLRGGYPTYVQANNFEPSISTSIHFMEDKWDNGDIVIQKEETCNPHLTNYERYRKSAYLASKLLHRLSVQNFDLKITKQNKEDISYCHKTLKVKKNISAFLKVDCLQGYVLSNYASHLYPFSYIRRGLLLMSILEISSSIEIYEGKKEKCLFNKNGKIYLNYFGSVFFIDKYLYKGSLIIQDKD